MSNYRPRRASKRWLEGAPDYVLSVHDKPSTNDRYTVFFGPPLWEPELGRNVLYLGMSEDPTHPQGVSMWGLAPSHFRDSSGRKIRWLDLPEHIRNHVIARAEEE
jgi:hypothetical protein